METTFITIHNLLPDANIQFASATITQILGYEPEEVIGRSSFDYFHPDEVPFARRVHSRGILLDKAAVLHYARIRARDGQWIGCECVFTVVHQVLVACTSIYRGNAQNERRAVEAPAIRRLFASSPRDPRYHMLEHLSSKFRTPPQESFLEPRAALILNRFTRTLTVMFATNAVTSILGVTPEQLNGKSFYECIQENCHRDAIRCLESAKENESIAYLRFWYRDPRREEDREDEQMREASLSSDSDEDGGVQLNGAMEVDPEGDVKIKTEDGITDQVSSNFSGGEAMGHNNSGTSSGKSSDRMSGARRAMFDAAGPSRSSASSVAAVQRHTIEPPQPLEIEAVVSCTSDGLVVVLRRARPMIPSVAHPALPPLANGLFAAPWGAQPIHPHVFQPNPQQPFEHGFGAPVIPPGGPTHDDLLASIQEVAVFAWSLVGINGNIATYGRGVPQGEAQPIGGIPIWNPYAVPVPLYPGPENQAARRWAPEKSRETQDDRVVPFQIQEMSFKNNQRYDANRMQIEHAPNLLHLDQQLAQSNFANWSTPLVTPPRLPRGEPRQDLPAVSTAGMSSSPPLTYHPSGSTYGSGEGSGTNGGGWANIDREM